MADPSALVDTITSNWEMPPDFLFDNANIPGPSSEEWPIDLLDALTDLSGLTAPDEDAPNETLRLQKFHRARDDLLEICTARADATGSPEAAVMTADDVFAVIEKIRKNTEAAAETQRLYAMRKEAPPVQYSPTADDLLFSKELSGEEELRRDREMTEPAGTIDSSRSPKTARKTEPTSKKAVQTRPSAQPFSSASIANFPFLEGLLKQGIVSSLNIKVVNSPAPQPPSCGITSLPSTSRSPSNQITSRDGSEPGAQQVSSLTSKPSLTPTSSAGSTNPSSATTTPLTAQTPPSTLTTPASTTSSTPRNSIMRARALRRLQNDLEIAELEIQRTEQLLNAKKLKRKIWEIEDEVEDEEMTDVDVEREAKSLKRRTWDAEDEIEDDEGQSEDRERRAKRVRFE